MFLNKKYVLANELVQKMGISIANISMLRNEFEHYDDTSTITKLNNCNFIKSGSHKLPKNISNAIETFELTDMSNKLPCTWIRTEYEVTEKELTRAGIITGKMKIAGKDFYEFTDEWVKKVKGKIVYTLNKEETEGCYEKGQILGFVQVSKNKFLTWY